MITTVIITQLNTANFFNTVNFSNTNKLLKFLVEN